MTARALRWLSVFLCLVCAAAAAQAQPEGPAPADADAAAGEAAAGAEETAPVDAGAAAAPDLDELRARYRALRDRLFQSRARAAAVASALYSTRVSIYLRFSSERSHSVSRASIRLDGASVFEDLEGAIAKDEAARFSGYVAPGRHVVTIRVESASKDDPSFTSTTESSFVVQAPAGKELIVSAVAADDGDMGYAWEKEAEGSYGLSLELEVEAVEPRDGGGHLRRTSRARSGYPAGILADVSKQLNFEEHGR